MESGTLPPPPMLLHSNDSFPPMSSSHSPMNQYSDIFSSKHSANTNTKTTKRKFDDIIDPAAGEFDSAGSALKPQKTDQQNVDPERSLSRTGTPLSNGSLPAPSSALSRNDNDNGPPSYEFSASNNNVNTGRTTPNSSLLSQPTPPPPPSLQQQQQPPLPSQQQGPPSAQPQQSMPPQQQPTMPPLPPPSSYMPMSPRNQYNLTSDSPFLQTNNQVFVFTTQLANEAAEAVMKNEYPNIVEYHRSLPNTAQFLSSISNNMNPNHNPMMGGMMHPNQGPPPPGCHSPRTMQMMMNGGPPPHHNPHLVHHNGNGGPPPNWPHPHFHPHQQQPSFGRLTPGSGGLPPPGHLLPPGAMMMNGASPPPGMRGMPPMPGMGPMPSDSTENLTPDQVKRRKNQLNKIEDLKTKITGGRARGGRAKANAAAMATPPGGIPPPVNGLPPPPGALDPHQQQMMMMNSPHGVGPPHHMMGMVPPPPHMLPPGMRGPPDGMMMEMNGPPPPHGYMNGPMPPGYHGQYGPGPGPGPNDPYGQMLPPHQQNQAMRDWNKMQLDHLEGKGPMRGQPPPYSSVSPSSLTPPIATTSSGGGPNSNLNSGKLLSPKMEPSGAPRLYKVGQPEKFIPDALPSANKKLPGAIGEVQMTSSPTQMDYNDLGMDGEELIITRHLNQAYRSNNNGTGNTGQPLPSSSSSSCKDEPMTPSQRSTSTPNHIANTLSSGKPPAGSTTPTHLSQGPPSHLSSQNASVASPRSSKLNTNSSLASPLMLGNPNSASKDDPLDMNGGPRTPTSNMAPPLSSMLQMTNSLQSAGSPYNPSNNSSMGGGLKSSSSMSGNGPPMVSPNLGHMSKSMDQLPPSSHMPLPPPHPQMQFQNMNPHHRMLGPHEPMPPHFNPPGGNFGPPPPGHPHMYKMRPPHHGMDPSGMMMPHPGGGPMRSSKGLPPPPSDPMQAHHLPPLHYQKMSNMDPHLGGPPPGHPQQHMRFGPMMDDGFNMGPPPPSHHPHHPHMHPHMHPHGPPMHHHPMHPNDGRLPPPQGPPPPQSINNTYVSTTMSIQQLNIQSLGPGGGPADLQSGTIHYHAPPGNGLDCPPPPGGPPGSTSNSTMFSSQQQFTSMTHIPGHDPSYPPQFNDLQPLPPNLSMDGVQPSNYW